MDEHKTTTLINNSLCRGLSRRPPKVLLVVVLFGFLAGFFLSAEHLILLGIMKVSFTHQDPRVKELAYATIGIVRYLSFAFAFGVGLVFIFWKQVCECRLVKVILNHDPIFPRPRFRGDIANFSLFSILFLLGMTLFYIAYAPSVFPNWLNSIIIQEDGVIEVATAFMFLLCSVLSLFLCRQVKAVRYKVFFAVFSALFFVCFGEEFSWGQRIFGFKTAEFLAKLNVQNETNIHNSFGYLADHLFILGILVYGFVMPALSARSKFFYKLFDKMGIPIASAGLAIGFFLITLLRDSVIWSLIPRWDLRLAEPRELLSAVALFLLLMEVRSFQRTAIRLTS